MDSPRLERITRSLAFMLRHQPERFDLEVDRYGWADLDDVVSALEERLDEDVEADEVRFAVESGDRRRYEIAGDRIRALYGHSIPVEPGESAKPPELLYVAIDDRDADRAARFGLRGGRRRFLHLALTEEDALETGRRTARDYTLITIRALDAWEDGVDFYDRVSLFLAEQIPTDLLEVGETYHDGVDPRDRGERGGRERERGGRERGGRGGRGRREGGRSRDRDRDRDRGHDRGARDDEPRGGSREERPREERPARGRDREERPSREREPRREPVTSGASRSSERPEPRSEARPEPRREPEPRQEPAARREPAARKEPARESSNPAGGFGAGLFESAAKKERAPKPEPPAPKKAPEPKPAPPAPKKDSGPGFGAGL